MPSLFSVPATLPVAEALSPPDPSAASLTDPWLWLIDSRADILILSEMLLLFSVSDSEAAVEAEADLLSDAAALALSLELALWLALSLVSSDPIESDPLDDALADPLSEALNDPAWLSERDALTDAAVLALTEADRA